MIDLSDGLSGDLHHICRSSRTGAEILADRIPFDANLDGLAKLFDEKVEYALHGGEDFKLLFTVNPNIFFERRNFFEKCNFKQVGVINGNEGIVKLTSGEKSAILKPKSFRHF
jgi:thiamine-monophosphate kinase